MTDWPEAVTKVYIDFEREEGNGACSSFAVSGGMQIMVIRGGLRCYE